MNINIYAKSDKIPNNINQDMQEKKKFSRPTKGDNYISIDLWTLICPSNNILSISSYAKFLKLISKIDRKTSVMDNF